MLYWRFTIHGDKYQLQETGIMDNSLLPPNSWESLEMVLPLSQEDASRPGLYLPPPQSCLYPLLLLVLGQKSLGWIQHWPITLRIRSLHAGMLHSTFILFSFIGFELGHLCLVYVELLNGRDFFWVFTATRTYCYLTLRYPLIDWTVILYNKTWKSGLPVSLWNQFVPGCNTWVSTLAKGPVLEYLLLAVLTP